MIVAHHALRAQRFRQHHITLKNSILKTVIFSTEFRFSVFTSASAGHRVIRQ